MPIYSLVGALGASYILVSYRRYLWSGWKTVASIMCCKTMFLFDALGARLADLAVSGVLTLVRRK
jgi:hypothetical protein